MVGVEEVCPYCEATVGGSDAYCARCGEPLTAFDDELGDYEGDDLDYDFDDRPDREVLADTAAGDDEAVVYRTRGDGERREELVLLAVVLGVAVVALGIFGWVLGWWGGGGDDDATDDQGPVSSSAQAVEVAPETDDADEAVALPESVALEQLEGLAVAVRDRSGVHVRWADGRDPVDIGAAMRFAEFDGGSVALSAQSLWFIDGASVHRHDLASGETRRVGPGDWVAAVPGAPQEIWLVDRRESDETGTIDVLVRVGPDGPMSTETILPANLRLDGATSAGVIVADTATGTKSVIGPDDFVATLVPTAGATDAVISPDGRWALRSTPGAVVARPVDGSADDDFTVVDVPDQMGEAVEFAVAVAAGAEP